MLSNFNLIKCCFGNDDDDPNNPEKFEIKNKRERKISYNPNHNKYNPNKKNLKNKANRMTGYNSESFSTQEYNQIENLKSNKDKENKENFKVEIDLDLKIKLSNIAQLKQERDIEYDYGNREYKLKICEITDKRIEELATQMKFRLEEGGGECFYEIGVEDNGNPLGLPIEELEQSLENIKTISCRLNAKADILNVYQGKVGLIAEVIVKNKEEIQIDKVEIKIGLLGEEGSGKSTLVGVLVSNKLDNGKGLARFNVFRHKHEVLCGKTSSFSHQILGFDENGELTNYGDLEKPSWAQIVNKSAKIINFYDMGGSKIFKNPMNAFSPNYLDYLFIVISALDGITEKTRDLINFSNHMNLPMLIIFTKIDLVTQGQQEILFKQLKSTSLNMKLKKVPLKIKSNEDIILFARNIQERNILPTFFISNIMWDGLNLLKTFLSMLPADSISDEVFKTIQEDKIEFDIHETLAVGEKVIITGIVNRGKLMSGSKFYLGPDNKGHFKIVEVVNIHCKKIAVRYAYIGQYCSLYIKSPSGISKDDVRKGMVLLDIKSEPVAVKIFQADLWTIDGSTKIIKYKYKPVLNIKHIRQGCRIINSNDLLIDDYEEEKIFKTLLEANLFDLNILTEKLEKLKLVKLGKESNNNKKLNLPSYNPDESFVISSTKQCKVIFEFMFNPEYITEGSHIIINDQSIKAYGIITKILK